MKVQASKKAKAKLRKLNSTPWGALNGRYSSVIHGARMDMTTYIEHYGKSPPVMFATKSDLEAWARNMGMSIFPPNTNTSGCILVVSNRTAANPGPGHVLGYDQLWVKATYRGYRKPFLKWHAGRDKVPQSAMSDLHADHVINRSRLKKTHPDAWVNLFPVPAHANTRFGSRIEKKLKALPVVALQVTLEALYFFKLFCTKMPKTKAELQDAMHSVKGQLLRQGATATTIDQFLVRMEAAIKQYLT